MQDQSLDSLNPQGFSSDMQQNQGGDLFSSGFSRSSPSKAGTQMEMPLDPAQGFRASKAPEKETLFSGNFLSRFLRRRNKNQQELSESSPPMDKALARGKGRHELSSYQGVSTQDSLDDELDVPTFMRQQGKGGR